jgi:hypothetical protein
MNADGIHGELCVAVYGQNVMSEEPIRQWCRMLKDVQKKITTKSEVVGSPSVMTKIF